MRDLILFFLLPALLICSLSGPAHCEEKPSPELTDIIITTSKTDLLLFATVTNCFSDEMLEGIQNGIPITFNFQIELDAVRGGWFDSTLVETVITHTLRYNSFKKEYLIDFSEKQGKQIATRSLEEAKTLMAEVNGFPLIGRDKLVPDAPYTLKIKATLAETTLPLGMHYVLPFTSFWNFETDWRTIEFRY